MRNFFLISMVFTVMGGGATLWGKPSLVKRDHALQGEPVQVRLMSWKGAPALSVMAESPREKGAPRGMVYVLTVKGGEWKQMGVWKLPDRTRYLEPIRFSPRRSGWLAMVGQQWRIAVPQGGVLRWTAVCACPTIFQQHGAPDRTAHRLVFDLTGDGRDEVVLPYPAYLEVYRTTEEPYALEPIWRLYWNTQRRRLIRREKKPPVYSMPKFDFPHIQHKGAPAWMIERGSHLLLAPLPPPGGKSFTLTRAGMEGVARKASPPLPPGLAAAAKPFYGRTFPSAGAFLAALSRSVKRETQVQWAPHLVAVLRAGRGRLPERTPYRANFPGLGPFNPEKDRHLLLAKEDLNGDGVLDVLHVKVLNHDSKGSRRNVLRWYRGEMSGGRLKFKADGPARESDVGSLAMVIHPRAGGNPPHEMLVASANVSYFSVIRALATGRATYTIRIFPWTRRTLATEPRTEREFVFDNPKRGRRIMFLTADLNGDGFRDYVFNRKHKVLEALLSSGARAGLTVTPLQGKEITMPSRQNRVLVSDLDGDGREELIAWYRVRYHGKLGRAIRMIRLAGNGGR